MDRRLPSLFVYSALGILLITGLAKIISAFGTSDVLKDFDPVFGLEFRMVFLIAGITEIIVVLLCLQISHLEIRVGIVAWVGTLFLAYRLSMLALDYRKPCGCLGDMVSMLHVSPDFADQAMKVILGYLLFGSYALLLCHWWRKRTTLSPLGASQRTHLAEHS